MSAAKQCLQADAFPPIVHAASASTGHSQAFIFKPLASPESGARPVTPRWGLRLAPHQRPWRCRWLQTRAGGTSPLPTGGAPRQRRAQGSIPGGAGPACAAEEAPEHLQPPPLPALLPPGAAEVSADALPTPARSPPGPPAPARHPPPGSLRRGTRRCCPAPGMCRPRAPNPAWLCGPSALPLHIPQNPAQEIPRGQEGASTSPKPAGDPPAPLGQPEAARRPPGLGAFLCPDPPAPGTPTPGLGQPQGPKSPSPDICTPSTAPHVLAPSTRAQRPAWDPHPTLPPVPLSLGGARCRRQGCPGGSLPALPASGRSPAPRVSLPECLPSSSTRANTATTRLLTTASPVPGAAHPSPGTGRRGPRRCWGAPP